MVICSRTTRTTGVLVFILGLLVLSYPVATAQTTVVPPGLCSDFAKRLDRMTTEQVTLITGVPASGRVWSRCAMLLRDDIVAGQKCVIDVCAEVDEDGVVEKIAGSLDNRLSSCARSTIDLVRISSSFDLLTTSFTKVCPRSTRPTAPQ
jgi:hypothetical protein